MRELRELSPAAFVDELARIFPDLKHVAIGATWTFAVTAKAMRTPRRVAQSTLHRQRHCAGAARRRAVSRRGFARPFSSAV